MNHAKNITDTITMKDIFSQYGFSPNQRGFICCPLHHEKTPSLGMYQNGKRWKCFGCGDGGSVIDFVMKYFGIGFKQAITKINYDFNLRLPISGKINIREQREMKKRERERKAKLQEEARIKKEKEDRRNFLLDEWTKYDKIIIKRMQEHPEAKSFYEVAEKDDWKWLVEMEYLEDLIKYEL